MDAFAVTISNSCAYPKATKRQRLAMPVLFGLFQGLMPLIGYYTVTLASSFIELYAGVIAFIILGTIGIRMIWNGSRAVRTARKSSAEPDLIHPPEHNSFEAFVFLPDKSHKFGKTEPKVQALSFRTLFLQAIATSIDALFCGVSLMALGADIFLSAPVIAIITFCCCMVALFIGRRVGVLLGNKAEIIGGAVLFVIGIKALF
jgi:putative Mn2+ efflux pump MntP